MRSVLFLLAFLLIGILFLLSCESNGTTGTGGALSGLVGERMDEELIEVELVESSEPVPEYGSPPELVLEAGSRSGEFVLFAFGTDTRIVFASILYDPGKVHFVGAFSGEIEQVIFLALDDGVGKVDVGWAIPHPEASPGPSGTVSLFTLKFAPGSRVRERMLSAVPGSILHKVDDLSVEWNEEALVLTFTERNPGDYDRGGDVTIADVALIALHYLEDVENNETDPIAVIDGSGDGQINIADVAIIAQQYLVAIDGYVIQYSFDAGLSFLLPSDPFVPDSIPYFKRDHAQVTVDQSGAFPIWTIEVPNENLPLVPDMFPGNPDLRVRVYPSDGEAPGTFSDGSEIVVTGGMDITPPVWDETVGITGLDPEIDSNTLNVTFGGSTDDSGEPTVFKIYYAKTVDFSIDAVNDETIMFTEYAPDPEVVPPYTIELVGLEPAFEYTALVRTRDRAFPVPNLDDNIVTMVIAVDAGGLFLGDIFVEDFEPFVAQPVLANVEVSGGDGVYSAAWVDGNDASGYFYFPDVDAGIASVTWASASAGELYNLTVEVFDTSGHRGVQQSSGIIVQTAAPPLFEDVVYPIIATSCAPCHVGQTLGGLDLGSAGIAWENIVGVPSSQSDLSLVKEFEPEDSYFVLKLDGRFIEAGGSGGLMPSPESPMSAGDIKTIIGWIFGGALGEGGAPDTAPPVWDDQVGVISVEQVADTQALDVTFDSATDEETPPVEYRLWYAPSATFDIGDLAGTATLEVFTSAGTKQVSGLEWSTEYTFLARARDSAEAKNETGNTNTMNGTVDESAVDDFEFTGITTDFEDLLEIGEQGNIDAVGVHEGGGVLTFEWESDPPGDVFDNQSDSDTGSNVDFSSPDEGSYNVTVSAYIDGDFKDSISVTVVVGTRIVFNPDLMNTIITADCISCHSGASPPRGLDLEGEGAYDLLVWVESQHNSSYLLVHPGDIEDSMFYFVASGDEKAPQGVPGHGFFPLDFLWTVEQWIKMGAWRDAVTPPPDPPS